MPCADEFTKEDLDWVIQTRDKMRRDADYCKTPEFHAEVYALSQRYTDKAITKAYVDLKNQMYTLEMGKAGEGMSMRRSE